MKTCSKHRVNYMFAKVRHKAALRMSNRLPQENSIRSDKQLSKRSKENLSPNYKSRNFACKVWNGTSAFYKGSPWWCWLSNEHCMSAKKQYSFGKTTFKKDNLNFSNYTQQVEIFHVWSKKGVKRDVPRFPFLGLFERAQWSHKLLRKATVGGSTPT